MHVILFKSEYIYKSLLNSHTSPNDLELKQARDEATVACNRLLGVLQRKRQAGNTDQEDLHELSQVLTTLAEEVDRHDSRVKRRRLQQSEKLHPSQLQSKLVRPHRQVSTRSSHHFADQQL